MPPTTLPSSPSHNDHLKQIKVSIDADLALAFKNACIKRDLSMASVLTSFMSSYVKASLSKPHTPDYTTRRKRKAALLTIGEELQKIKDYEEDYRERIPDNLRASMTYERAEALVTLLDEIIDLLAEVW